jgi:uncharacterized protein YjiS (DUF1127 family)
VKIQNTSLNVIGKIRNIRFTYQSTFANLASSTEVRRFRAAASDGGRQRELSSIPTSEKAMIAMPGVSIDEAAPPAAAAATSAMPRWLNWLTAIWRHRRDLELLASFDDHMLADIGLMRTDLHQAMAQPRWHDPTALLSDRRRERRESRRGMVFRFAGQIAVAPTYRFRAGDTGTLAETAVLTW